jgi:hypothetical protein
MNRKNKPYDKQFWELVADEQIELFTKRESQRSKPQPKQNTKVTYKLDTYQGIEYGQRMINKFTPKVEVTDTTEYVVTKLPSQTKAKRRSML